MPPGWMSVINPPGNVMSDAQHWARITPAQTRTPNPGLEVWRLRRGDRVTSVSSETTTGPAPDSMCSYSRAANCVRRALRESVSLVRGLEPRRADLVADERSRRIAIGCWRRSPRRSSMRSSRKPRPRACSRTNIFTVDGTQLEVWASLKSFKPRGTKPSEPPDDPGNPTVNFRGEKRSNTTHESTTDPEAQLYKKADGPKSVMAYLGHVLMENRHGLIVNACATAAIGTAEREAAAIMLLTGIASSDAGRRQELRCRQFCRARSCRRHHAAWRRRSSSRRSTIGPRDMPGI